jgi:hypothetical protein
MCYSIIVLLQYIYYVPFHSILFHYVLSYSFMLHFLFRYVPFYSILLRYICYVLFHSILSYSILLPCLLCSILLYSILLYFIPLCYILFFSFIRHSLKYKCLYSKCLPSLFILPLSNFFHLVFPFSGSLYSNNFCASRSYIILRTPIICWYVALSCVLKHFLVRWFPLQICVFLCISRFVSVISADGHKWRLTVSALSIRTHQFQTTNLIHAVPYH